MIAVPKVPSDPLRPSPALSAQFVSGCIDPSVCGSLLVIKTKCQGTVLSRLKQDTEKMPRGRRAGQPKTNTSLRCPLPEVAAISLQSDRASSPKGTGMRRVMRDAVSKVSPRIHEDPSRKFFASLSQRCPPRVGTGWSHAQSHAGHHDGCPTVSEASFSCMRLWLQLDLWGVLTPAGLLLCHATLLSKIGLPSVTPDLGIRVSEGSACFSDHIA